jgi:hypothetical protein
MLHWIFANSRSRIDRARREPPRSRRSAAAELTDRRPLR